MQLLKLCTPHKPLKAMTTSGHLESILRAFQGCSREAEEVVLGYIICHTPFLSSFFR